MKPRYHEIPEELQQIPNWVAWNPEKRTSRSGQIREVKILYNVRTGRLAKSNDPSTWAKFPDALRALDRGYHGLAFGIVRPLIAADLDGCRQNGVCEPWAEQLIRTLDTYTECSPSETGAHALAKGELPAGPRQKDFHDRPHHGVALYDQGRFICMTGLRIGANKVIAERTDQLRQIYAQLFPPKTKPSAKTQAGPAASISDEQLIAQALKANDGGKFARLWNGQWENEYPSQSEADFALCMKLAFWTNRDAGRADQLFRRSALMREKWNRQDYREATIAKAIDQTTETYRPRGADRRNRGVTEIRVDALAPSLEILNALNIFGGRISFTLLRRRGALIEAHFEHGTRAIWRTAGELASFRESQHILFAATGQLLATPPQRKVLASWEPAAQLIRRIADQDAVDTRPALEDEFADILSATFERAGRPVIGTTAEWIAMLRECTSHKRNPQSPTPPRCAVWAGEGYAWVHMPSLVEWLSTPSARNKHFAWEDVRTALLLLDFVQRDLHRSHDTSEAHARVWRGPLDLLTTEKGGDAVASVAVQTRKR
jgi:hypothetical protein